LEETKWRLKIHAIWLAEGDNNTKFFQKYVTYRRKFNHIWELIGPNGSQVSSFKDLAHACIQHFQSLFKESDVANIREIMKVVRLFPRFFNDEMNEIMESEVTKEELKVVLGTFKKAKSPSLDGWTMEFFLRFYDFLEDELLRVIEESRRFGKMLGALNATFIALILKKNDPSTFDDFRSISLCNLIYKIVSKIIANINETSTCPIPFWRNNLAFFSIGRFMMLSDNLGGVSFNKNWKTTHNSHEN
jgi:hypothetical protein